jgi:class 3 adenylate cyclase
MSYREQKYRWDYALEASPEELWPFISDTNRFNRDTGVPAVKPAGPKQRLSNARRRLQFSIYGMSVEWEEQPFEWLRPSRFGVVRKYSKGPMVELRALAELKPRTDGGTDLTYSLNITPRSIFAALIVWLQINFVNKKRFERAFRKYDEAARTKAELPAHEVEIDESAASRMQIVRAKLIADGSDPEVVDRLINFIQTADDFSLSRIRPYELADNWQTSRRAVLEACLRATRQGLLDLQWEVMCPLCRGPQETDSTLHDLTQQVHCETCMIDFTVNFDRFVELTFRPNALVRRIEALDYCMGSPQWTPHIVVQQLMPAHETRELKLVLEPGKYRLRALELPGAQEVVVSDDGYKSAELIVDGWANDELKLSPQSTLQVKNATSAEQLLILEKIAWSDQAATAAQVTALQIFRDLFSKEALRPGEQISVGTLTILFTDLRHSTQLYREVGDATAFGRVMNHFDVLKKVIADEEGALVKTIGDAVMAVFRRPSSAVKAMLTAQELLATPGPDRLPLTLKAGIHTGPCIAVTLNDRLDYFGTTVNLAARLEGMSTGEDVIISRALFDDPEVESFIKSEGLTAVRFEIELKGFANERIELLRVARG